MPLCRLGKVGHATTRIVSLTPGCCQDTNRPLILGNIHRHRPMTPADRRRQQKLCRHPGSDHRVCRRSGRRVSTRGRSCLHLPSCCPNLTNTTDTVGTDILARRSVVYTVLPTDVDDLDFSNRQTWHYEPAASLWCEEPFAGLDLILRLNPSWENKIPNPWLISWCLTFWPAAGDSQIQPDRVFVFSGKMSEMTCYVGRWIPH